MDYREKQEDEKEEIKKYRQERTREQEDKHIRGEKRYRMAFLNAKGASHIAERERMVHIMKTRKIDVLLLAGVHNNSNSTEKRDGYTFTLSTSVTDEWEKCVSCYSIDRVRCTLSRAWLTWLGRHRACSG